MNDNGQRARYTKNTNSFLESTGKRPDGAEVEQPNTKEKYRKVIVCSNCMVASVFELDFGTTTRDFESKTICSYCGCYLNGDELK